MGIRILNARQRALIADEAGTRLAVFAGARGRTRVVSGPQISLTQDGRLLLLELVGRPEGDGELVAQLAQQQTVTLGFGNTQGELLNVVAKACERHTVGRLFQTLHGQAAERGDALMAVWVLEALEVESEEDGFPFLAVGSASRNAFAAWAAGA